MFLFLRSVFMPILFVSVMLSGCVVMHPQAARYNTAHPRPPGPTEANPTALTSVGASSINFPSIRAQAFVVLDVDSGERLLARDDDTPLPAGNFAQLFTVHALLEAVNQKLLDPAKFARATLARRYTDWASNARGGSEDAFPELLSRLLNQSDAPLRSALEIEIERRSVSGEPLAAFLAREAQAARDIATGSREQVQRVEDADLLTARSLARFVAALIRKHELEPYAGSSSWWQPQKNALALRSAGHLLVAQDEAGLGAVVVSLHSHPRLLAVVIHSPKRSPSLVAATLLNLAQQKMAFHHEGSP